MEYYGYTVLSMLITAAVGWPIAHALLPAPYRRFSLAVSPLFGYAYAVFVAYIFYRLNVAGTNAYAALMTVPPVAALTTIIGSGRLRLRDQDFIPVAIYVFAVFVVSQLFVVAGGRALAFGLGNPDIVDLAAAARFTQEFPRETTVGFFGVSDFIKIEIDEQWAGPSLFAAYLSSLTGSAPWKLQAISLAIVTTQTPVVAWLIARFGLSLRSTASAAAAVLCAVNPLSVYVVWMSFGAQSVTMPLALGAIFFFMIAMQAVKDRLALAQCAAAVIVLMSGVIVSYHFMVLIIFGLMGAYLFFLALARLSLRDFFIGALFLVATAALTLLLNPWRTQAMIKMLLMLFGSSNGWFHPWLSPERQLGFEIATELFRRPSAAWVRPVGVTVAAALSVLTFWALIRRRDPRHLAFVAGLALPVFLIGLAMAFRGAENGVLGGYQGFKFTGTFVAFTILSFAIPFGLERSATETGPPRRLAASIMPVAGAAFFTLLLAVGVVNLRSMVSGGRSSYLIPEDFPTMQQVERMPFPGGVNLVEMDHFTVFWAHYFSLEKQQTFAAFPYAGRPVKPFNQPYTIMLAPSQTAQRPPSGDIFSVDLPASANVTRLNSVLIIVRQDQIPRIKLTPGAGWWPSEGTHRWTGSDGRRAVVEVENAGPPTSVMLRGRFEGLRTGDGITVSLNGVQLTPNQKPGSIETSPFELPAGKSSIEITAAMDPWQAPAPDPRKVGVMWYEVRLTPQ